MQYMHSDLGNVPAGSSVVVHLSGTEANVRLVDDLNLARYRRGDSHEYYGGHFTASPAVVRVPSTGRWNVVVDLGGFGGSVRASVKVIAA